MVERIIDGMSPEGKKKESHGQRLDEPLSIFGGFEVMALLK